MCGSGGGVACIHGEQGGLFLICTEVPHRLPGTPVWLKQQLGQQKTHWHRQSLTPHACRGLFSVCGPASLEALKGRDSDSSWHVSLSDQPCAGHRALDSENAVLSKSCKGWRGVSRTGLEDVCRVHTWQVTAQERGEEGLTRIEGL